MRMIDANAIEAKIENIFRRLVASQNKPDLAAALSYVGDLISEAPTVDAVPVVRCKDCEHFYHSVSSDRDGRCVQFGTYDTDPSVYLNDFCSYGERRTNEG